MRLTLGCWLLIVTAGPALAQDIKHEINKQVWTTLIEGYNTFDTDKFMSVYSKNVVRVPADQKRIFDYAEYKKNINRENHFNRSYKIKASLEIRFLSRIHSPNVAYETGILKIKMIDNNGKPATIYSKFQVVLRKQNGSWKIEFDTDSTDSNTVSEKDFAKAEPM